MNGQEFKKLRKELGMTQAKCADLLFVSTRTIQNYEMGVHNVPRVYAQMLQIHKASAQKANEGHTPNNERRD